MKTTAEDVLDALQRVHAATGQREVRVHVHSPHLRIVAGDATLAEGLSFPAAVAWLDGFRVAWARLTPREDGR